MWLAARVAIFCLAVTAVLSLNDATTFTRRRYQHLKGPPYVRQAADNGTGHTQVYCHSETQPPTYFSNYLMTTLTYLLMYSRRSLTCMWFKLPSRTTEVPGCTS